ncbi:MAG: isoprenylcysteine carboxylmethyltransferase family protein [Nannocystaceae bacterium]|nr:isoprenylcysteine carboxylmethyltransferase family protein [Nannocystaceae bacterium]
MHGDTLCSLTLGLLTLYGLIALVGRTALQRLREDDSGWRGISGRRGSVAWWAGVLLAVSVVGLGLAAALAPAEPSVARWRVLVGGVGFGLGFMFTLHAQLAMGPSWRVGVQTGEQTELRTSGPFGWCRNPVFTAMLLSTGALAVWVPWLLIPWTLMLLSLELQVRVVEEPHLLTAHGETYRDYARHTGRFLPGLGRGLDSSAGQ